MKLPLPASLVGALALLASLSAPAQALHPADVAQLLKDVHEIDCAGVPGPLVTVGTEAFPVVVAKVADNLTAPLVAATRFGNGRVVAFGHGGFLDAGSKLDSQTLVLNSLAWCARQPTPAAGQIKVGVHRNDGLLKLLQAQGMKAEKLEGNPWEQRLGGYQVIVADTTAFNTDALRTAMTQYLRQGGGLLTSGPGWGWLQLNPGKSLHLDHPGNRLLAEAGLLWADGTLSRASGKGFAVSATPSPITHATRALDTLLVMTNSPTPATQPIIAQATWTVTTAARTLPPNDRLLLPQIQSLARQPGATKLPASRQPLRAQDGAARLVLTLQIQEAERAPAAQVKAHPASANFPGRVPRDARRLTGQKFTLNTAVPAWHSTGLYAAPGEVIRLNLPAEAVKNKLTVRIGAHTDRLWEKPSWQRSPDVAISQSLSATNTEIASAFGGLIYIDVPENCPASTVVVGISGAVAAPHFILGRTTLEEWRKTIRQHPAPWAELETSKVIFTFPSSTLRALDDPEALLKTWDRVLDGIADLSAIPHERKRPERIVADEQISAGYMHSGYPIMTPLDSVAIATTLSDLTTKGSWGHFHELGHNHQKSEWTFDGTTEVTCNLYSLYTYERVLGLPRDGHGSITADKREANMKKYFSGGAKFETWKNDPFLALVSYYQLVDAFGWDSFKRVFAEYRDLPKDQRPKNDNEERDQWLVRYSKTVGKNLGPFYEAWGIPTSPAARASIKHLPAWLPEPDFPRKYSGK
jgi:hypothetical protein